jgi:hypothetical protein
MGQRDCTFLKKVYESQSGPRMHSAVTGHIVNEMLVRNE